MQRILRCSTDVNADRGVPSIVTTVHVLLAQVVAMARQRFNCSTLIGVPLEDQALGMGVHWEARVLGPEVCTTAVSYRCPFSSHVLPLLSRPSSLQRFSLDVFLHTYRTSRALCMDFHDTVMRPSPIHTAADVVRWTKWRGLRFGPNFCVFEGACMCRWKTSQTCCSLPYDL